MIKPLPAMGLGRKIVVWFGIIVAIPAFAAMTIGGAIGGSASWQRIPNETAIATGTVLKAGHCGGRYSKHGTARFVVSGTSYPADVSCKAHAGQRVQVRYDPADPSHNNDSRYGAVVLFVIGGFGLVLLVSMIAVMIALFRTPTLARSGR